MGSSRSARYCRIAPSTYHAHVAKRRDPARLSARTRQDIRLKIEVRRVFDENFSVYGVRKVWRQLKREGFDVARCTVSRLMMGHGIATVLSVGKPVQKMERCDDAHTGALRIDVNRQFKVPRLNVRPGSPTSRYVATWTGFVNVRLLCKLSL